MERLTDKEQTDILAVLRALKQVVAEAGEDYVYQRRPSSLSVDGACNYVHNGEPDCIAARVLVKLGVPISYFLGQEGRGCDSMFGTGIEQKALWVLRIAQITQDSNRNWGDARDRALEEALIKYGVIGA